MSSFRNVFFRLTHASPERKASRVHLKQAKTGNAEAYLALTANYLNLPFVYFGGCLHEASETRFARVEQVFTALWQHLPYADRVSDFEYLLASALLENTPDGSVSSSSDLVSKLRLLAPTTRFAFIAHEFEKWPLRWVALFMRMRPRAFHRLLSEARCELCGISWKSLCPDERQCLEAISISMNEAPNNLRANKELCRRVSNFPRVSEIKALWLELRPELVEVRHRYLPELPEREQLMRNIYKAVQIAPMNQPPFVRRVVSSVPFARHGKIKVS